MFEKILVANRGEIAVRIIRACKELNIRTVAVYSESDANSMHVQLADEAICIGKPASNESYLRIDRIISAAEIADVDAIHPGYGFLSENAHFADVCGSCNIRFIGPSSRAMNALEDKAVSRALAKKAGVPTPPGSDGLVENEQQAKEIANYTTAGTVEFIVDDKGKFFFLEVNKRIQVEHPITEEVTGIDLVKQQILIAMGEPLRLSQSDIQIKGHAIECRINAEDPFDDFRPCPGRIEMYYAPGGLGVRIDSHVYAGYTIPSHYDSMIGKLITHGRDRREAMHKMSRALREYMITG